MSGPLIFFCHTARKNEYRPFAKTRNWLRFCGKRIFALPAELKNLVPEATNVRPGTGLCLCAWNSI